MKTLKQIQEEVLQELSGKTLSNYLKRARPEKDQFRKYEIDHHTFGKKETKRGNKIDAKIHYNLADYFNKKSENRAKGIRLAHKAIERKP